MPLTGKKILFKNGGDGKLMGVDPLNAKIAEQLLRSNFNSSNLNSVFETTRSPTQVAPSIEQTMPTSQDRHSIQLMHGTLPARLAPATSHGKREHKGIMASEMLDTESEYAHRSHSALA